MHKTVQKAIWGSWCRTVNRGCSTYSEEVMNLIFLGEGQWCGDAICIAYGIWWVALTVLLSAADTHVANVWRWATLDFACFAVCLFACDPAGAASVRVFTTENTPARIAVLGRFYVRWTSLALCVEKRLVLVALEASTDGDYKVTHGGQRNTSLWCNQEQQIRYLEKLKLWWSAREMWPEFICQRKLWHRFWVSGPQKFPLLSDVGEGTLATVDWLNTGPFGDLAMMCGQCWSLSIFYKYGTTSKDSSVRVSQWIRDHHVHMPRSSDFLIDCRLVRIDDHRTPGLTRNSETVWQRRHVWTLCD